MILWQKRQFVIASSHAARPTTAGRGELLFAQTSTTISHASTIAFPTTTSPSSTLTTTATTPPLSSTAAAQTSQLAATTTQTSSSKNTVVIVATVIPILCVVFLLLGFLFYRYRRRRALGYSNHPEPEPSPTQELKVQSRPDPPMLERLQYPPIHAQHTKPLPPSPSTASVRRKSTRSLSRFTIGSKFNISSSLPSFKKLGRKRSTSTFTASSHTPCLPELPATSGSQSTYEAGISSPALYQATPVPLSRRSTRESRRSTVYPATEMGDGSSTFINHSGIRMSQFFPFLRIDPAGSPATRTASPVPSSSISTRHMSFPPPYRSMHEATDAFTDTGSIRTARSPSRVSRRFSHKSLASLRPRSSLVSPRSQRKTGLFGPRSPSSLLSIRTSITSSTPTTASPLTLAAEMASLFPDPPQGAPPKPWASRKSRSGGPRPPPVSFRASHSDQSYTLMHSPGDDESFDAYTGQPLARPLPGVPKAAALKPKKSARRSLVSRLSNFAGSRSRPQSPQQGVQDAQQTQAPVSQPAPAAIPEPQQGPRRSLPLVPNSQPHTLSNTIPINSQSRRKRPPLPPIPQSEEIPQSTAPSP